MGRKILVVIFNFILSAFFPFAEEFKTKVTTGGASVEDIVFYQGPTARIAVGSFNIEETRAYGRIGEGVQDMLIDALFRTTEYK